MTPREIISVGPAWATEAGNKVVVATQADHRMLCEMQKAYELGREHGGKHADRQFYVGVVVATIIWSALTLAVRWWL